MHADGFGDFCHRHRFQMRWAVLEEIELPRNDLLRDVHDCLLPLMDRADQEFAAADLSRMPYLDVAALRVARRNDVLIQVADPQMRNLFVVERDLIFAVDVFHDHVRQHVIRAARQRRSGRDEDSIARYCRQPFAHPRR